MSSLSCNSLARNASRNGSLISARALYTLLLICLCIDHLQCRELFHLLFFSTSASFSIVLSFSFPLSSNHLFALASRLVYDSTTHTISPILLSLLFWLFRSLFPPYLLCFAAFLLAAAFVFNSFPFQPASKKEHLISSLSLFSAQFIMSCLLPVVVVFHSNYALPVFLMSLLMHCNAIRFDLSCLSLSVSLTV